MVDAGTLPDGGVPGPGDTCTTAVSFVTGTSLNGESTATRYANNYAPAGSATNCTGALNGGYDKVYSFTIGAGQRMTATVKPVAPTAGADPSIYLLAPDGGCPSFPASCLAGSDRMGAGVDETLVFVNASMAVPVFLVVDTSVTLNPAMSYNLTVTLDVAPSSGDVCSAPNVLGSTTLTNETTVGFTDNYFGPSTNCANANGGPDRVYSLSIPVGQRATVTVTPVASFDTSLSMLSSSSGCNAPRTCVDNADSFGAGQPETLTVANRGTGTQSLLWIVDSATQPGDAFSIGAAFGAIPPGDHCGNAGAAITASSTSPASTVGYTNDYRAGTACGSAAGLDRVHAVTVPAAYRLTATVHPTSAWNPSISLVNSGSCETTPRSCIVSSDVAGATQDDTLHYDNNSTMAQSLFVIVDSVDLFTPGTYDLIIDLSVKPAPVQGDTCSNPDIVTVGTYSQTTVGFTNDYSPVASAPNCTGYIEPGADHVYSMSIPIGKTLTVTATPTSLGDPAIYLLANTSSCIPSPLSCLAGKDAAGLGAQETLSYANPGTSALNVFIVIDTDYQAFTFDLAISLQ